MGHTEICWKGGLHAAIREIGATQFENWLMILVWEAQHVDKQQKKKEQLI